MKKLLIPTIGLLTLALIATSCASVVASGKDNVRTMNVSGVGTVLLEPDIARVNIGVRSQSLEIAEALEENNTSAEAIFQSLTDMGIEKSDIRTSNFNIYPQQDYRPLEMGEGGEIQTTFVVENTLFVTVRDLDSLGEVLSVVIDKGANTIYGVTFDVEDKTAAVAEARLLAIDNAKEQAQAIADTAGVKLGAIHFISIDEGGMTPLTREFAVEQGLGGGGSVPISEGSLTIRVTANLTFEVE